MKTAQESYAITHFAELLRQAEEGETIEVVREGLAVVRLVPVVKQEYPAVDPLVLRKAIETLRALPRVPLPEGVNSIRNLINEGRGY